MFDKLKSNLMSDKVLIRIVTAYLCFLIIFNSITVISYYLLPEGFLLNKNKLHGWDNSPNLIILMLQIFFYNSLSVIVILFGNLFKSRKNKVKSYISYGYLAFFVMISVNAITLGTWSFSVITAPVPLIDRLIRTFDIVHRAGLLEMSGQLLITCATIKIAFLITDGKVTTKRKDSIRLLGREKVVLTVGILFMLLGAFIESNAIINLN